MRTLLLYLSLFFLSIATVHAQSMKKMVQKTEFENRLAKEAQTVESIESDFTQVKYLDVFDEKVTSKGKFYYQKSNKICMEYFRPMDYLIVINGSKLKIVSDGKKSIMNLSSNKMMAQMQDMLTACMINRPAKQYKPILPVSKFIWTRKICRYTNSACPKQLQTTQNTNSIIKSSTL